MNRARRFLRHAAVGFQLIQPPHHFQPAESARKLEFPRDHGAHRDAAYEWWYWTGHLMAGNEGSSKNTPDIAGFQATVFRVSPPGGNLPASGNRPENASWLVVHTGISDFQGKTLTHRSWATRERTVNDVMTDRAKDRVKDRVKDLEKDLMPVRVDDTRLAIEMPGLSATMPATPPDSFRLSFDLPQKIPARSPPRIEMRLTSRKPLTLHGDNGYSRKGPCPTCASHYSSYSRLDGTFSISGVQGSLPGLPGSGSVAGWYDHEFGSQSIDPAQTGWDWFSIQLDKPAVEIMLFQVRGSDPAKTWRAGTFIDEKGIARPVTDAEIYPEGAWTSARSKGKYPRAWTVKIPS
ncbi:hypothetical protein EBZ80_14760, partial [bacterium]|nr:hypothetical protein [bacterium]